MEQRDKFENEEYVYYASCHAYCKTKSTCMVDTQEKGDAVINLVEVVIH